MGLLLIPVSAVLTFFALFIIGQAALILISSSILATIAALITGAAIKIAHL